MADSYDERFPDGQRLQQALMYYRPHVDDLQYTYPLDFCPIYNIETQEIVHIDIPEVRRPLNTAPPTNYDAESIQAETGLRDDLKPINTSQPEGVSFKMDGRTIDWQKWNLHVGFNYREGIVLSNVTFNDRGNVRPVSRLYVVMHDLLLITVNLSDLLAHLSRRNGRSLRES